MQPFLAGLPGMATNQPAYQECSCNITGVTCRSVQADVTGFYPVSDSAGSKFLVFTLHQHRQQV
jgi:hypothetical protein